ncbi:hypothetical protein JIN85_04540 [Luteolibacter pohnpeiensis]|uniref:DUF4175 domain-containing protein n=1 Tax=Luteolibacter pohnpeiensis TaxID=454153 RepID=A0A934S4C1_9BACT|nr:hypothetical protein [Luteolibacter pohnpeiensis]MBK1881668.1 hypothetical protein [Luteolibacter pohnpeiensis]
MSEYHKALSRFQLRQQLGRLLAILLGGLAWIALLWLCFGWLDAIHAFESPARIAITWALWILTTIAVVLAGIRFLPVRKRAAADQADLALGDSRRPISAALSLDSSSSDSPLGKLLADRSSTAAATALNQLPWQKTVPWRLSKLPLIAVMALLLVMLALWLGFPGAFVTVANRLLHPTADTPPFSHLVFEIDPAQPAVVYGDELLLHARITGGALEHPVECRVRLQRNGTHLRLPAFRESPTRFSRKLDGVTEPVEIAFACGKARSKWIPVEVMLQPNILAGKVRITPPAYTGMPEMVRPLDTNEISAIEGSTVTLELSSNRPLGSGELTFTPASVPGSEPEAEIYPGTVTTESAVAFSWQAVRPGRLSATLKDIRGTSCAEPLELNLRIIPDQAPVVELSSPPPLLLATPRSVIPIRGHAEDDFMLSQLQFVRTLQGFRDRVKTVAPEISERSYDFTDRFDLDELGLEAGQTIELMLEASDHNPSLLGYGSSSISRIQIISEDQYAEYIRAKTTLAQFDARFRAAQDAMRQARESLQKLKESPDDPKALESARKAQREAAELLEKIADDFTAFDLEKRLQDLARKQAEGLRENLQQLEHFQPQDLDEMLDRLGRQEPEEKQLADDVQFTDDVSSLLEMASRFREIYETQVSIAKRLETIVKELRNGQAQNRRLIPSLADTQAKNRQALDQFKADLRARVNQLQGKHDELAPLIDSAISFLNDLDLAAPETLMDAAAEHGHAGRANDAYTNAELAKEILARLMSKPESFAQATQGIPPSFQGAPDVNKNIEQMLESLFAQRNGQRGNGGDGQDNMGTGGNGGSGTPMSGFSTNLPVVGPDRLDFQPLASSSGQDGGKGKPGLIAPLPTTAEQGRITPTDLQSGDAPQLSEEPVPEPYREAVKGYFTP